MNSSMMSHSQMSGSDSGTGPSESVRRDWCEWAKELVEAERTEEVVEKLAAVLVRVEAVVDVR